eukprot:TRINITY_DN299_c0_g1_i4.p1 TRINITY_DN299_c0_g1~~TRINITY_DN299_c0_g1_i4.p1  ORF type:complete len:113 (-),score=35.38 TRINITY_DN299_c0_g1_i4:218-556(-)
MEKVPTDSRDRPKQEILLQNVIVFVNPFNTLEEERIKEEEDKKAKAAKEKEDAQRGEWFSNPSGAKPTPLKKGVGKYLSQPSSVSRGSKRPRLALAAPSSRKRQKKSDFSSF